MATATLDRKELKAALAAQLKIVDEGMDKGVEVKADDSPNDAPTVHMTQETKDAIQAAFAEAREIKSNLDMLDWSSEVKSYMDKPEGREQSVTGQVHADSRTHIESKSLGEMFSDSPEFKSLIDSGRLTMETPFNLDVQNVGELYGQKDVFTGMASSNYTRTMGTIQFDPMVPRAYRNLRVRDLFPVAGTDASVIDFFRVLGFQGGISGAASVADRRAADGTSAPIGDNTDVFGRKPQSRLQFESAQAPVRTIAHWEAAHRNVLADVPQLRATIDNELLYGLRLEEDRQILDGSGLNDELLGVLRTPGIQAYTAAPAELRSDTLRKAATRVLLANYQSTGFVLHPYDWEKIEIQKGNDGQYMLVSNIAVGAGATVWRQPVIETSAMNEGTFLTGAWGLGAQLYDRQQANVRISEHHEDFFVRNAIVVLVEERLALACKRPEAFVKGTFSTT